MFLLTCKYISHELLVVQVSEYFDLHNQLVTWFLRVWTPLWLFKISSLKIWCTTRLFESSMSNLSRTIILELRSHSLNRAFFLLHVMSYHLSITSVVWSTHLIPSLLHNFLHFSHPFPPSTQPSSDNSCWYVPQHHKSHTSSHSTTSEPPPLERPDDFSPWVKSPIYLAWAA